MHPQNGTANSPEKFFVAFVPFDRIKLVAFQVERTVQCDRLAKDHASGHVHPDQSQCPAT